jgi:uncharacterized OsmC-like protein/fermentation-respiration switch protein FrsA (DUF1100 family)
MMRNELFEFEGEQGSRLIGKLDLPDGPPHSYALFAHCFTCTKESLAAVRTGRALAGQGIGVLRFDFTGLGQSGGDFADSTFSGSVKDVLAAARAMRSASIEPTLLIGHSLGGAAVLAAAADLPNVKAIATIGAPFDVQHVTRLFGEDLQTLLEQGEAEVKLGGRAFKMRRSFIDDLGAHDQRQRIGGLRRALLVLHAPMDRTVDIDNAAQIFQAARHPKSLVSLDDADHLLTMSVDSAYAAEVISAWAARYVGKPPPRSASEPGKVVVEEIGESNFQVEVLAGGVRFLADEPVEVGGLGGGPTPYDLLCAALGACTAMTVRMYARRKEWPLRRVRVCVGHARTKEEDPPDGFLREVALEGDLTEEQRSRLIEIAERCPVHASLKQGARVSTQQVGQIIPLADVEGAGQHAQDMAVD